MRTHALSRLNTAFNNQEMRLKLKMRLKHGNCAVFDWIVEHSGELWNRFVHARTEAIAGLRSRNCLAHIMSVPRTHGVKYYLLAQMVLTLALLVDLN